MKYAPWILAALTSTIAVGLFLRGPNVVIKEVPVEVIKLVTKEVPVEVIKTVTKEVERKLTDQESIAIHQHKLLMAAPAITKFSDPLKGMLILSVDVKFDENLKKKWSEFEVKEKLVLELRKIGIQVVKDDEPRCMGRLLVSGSSLISETTQSTTYILNWEINSTITSLQWDLNYRAWNAIHAHGGTFGFFGSAKAADAQRNAFDTVIVEISNNLLEANPIKRN